MGFCRARSALATPYNEPPRSGFPRRAEWPQRHGSGVASPSGSGRDVPSHPFGGLGAEEAPRGSCAAEAPVLLRSNTYGREAAYSYFLARGLTRAMWPQRAQRSNSGLSDRMSRSEMSLLPQVLTMDPKSTIAEANIFNLFADDGFQAAVGAFLPTAWHRCPGSFVTEHGWCSCNGV